MPVPPPSRRPALDATLTAAELGRWYWLTSELVELARALGVGTSGSKQVLTARLQRRLAGEPPTETDDAPVRPRVAAQLTGPLTPATTIPRGQRCTQHLRAWLDQQVDGFRFDAAMRGFLATTDGSQTLADAVAHWHATRGRPPESIGAQFEYNRFCRAWSGTHPEGTAAARREAWLAYRDTPLGERERS